MPRAAATKVVYVQAPPPRKKRAPAKSTAKYPMSRISGHGDYTQYGPFGGKRYSGSPTYNNPGIWGNAGRIAGGLMGKAIGGPAGGAIGSKLGSYAHYIGKIFGSGDYVTASAGVKQNSVQGLGSQVPSFGTESIRIRRREYIGDIISSPTANTFNIQSFALNPGLAGTFPWMSEVCGNTYQQYRINGMVFEFRSMSADALNSTNTALGSVVMCTDYDSKDAVFTTKQQMENTMFGVSCKPSSCMIHAIECARNQTSVSELYIRSGAVPSGADIRLYDHGRFSVATTGVQGTNVNLGELWVSADFTLLKPITQPPGYGDLMVHYNLSGASGLTPLALDTSVNAVQPVFDTIGIDSRTNSTIVMPLNMQQDSYWMVLFLVRGSSTAGAGSPLITASGGLVSGGGFINDASSGWFTPASITTTVTAGAIFRYNGSGTLAVPPTITFSTGSTFPSAVVAGDLHIWRVNPGVTFNAGVYT